MATPRKAAILLNLGTPDDASVPAVRRYLREFLMDPEVIDIPAVLRAALVYGAILPKRPRQSAAAYAKIWDARRGSPLRYHLDDLVAKVSTRLGPDWVTIPAMRYGQPSIAQALERAKAAGATEITFFPLYPQYSLAATKSSVDRARLLAARIAPGVPIRFIGAFHDDPGFLCAFEQVIRRGLDEFAGWQHVLFSFHGLPERQVKRAGGVTCLASTSCCDRLTKGSDGNEHCYRAQCFATARALAARLGLSADRWSVSFQSRLGRTPWIQPFTDIVYGELARAGKRRIAIACPAFVADCLETLEEISIRGQEQFEALGGEAVRLIPSLNSTDAWADAVAAKVRSGSSAGLPGRP